MTRQYGHTSCRGGGQRSCQTVGLELALADLQAWQLELDLKPEPLPRRRAAAPAAAASQCRPFQFCCRKGLIHCCHRLAAFAFDTVMTRTVPPVVGPGPGRFELEPVEDIRAMSVPSTGPVRDNLSRPLLRSYFLCSIATKNVLGGFIFRTAPISK